MIFLSFGLVYAGFALFAKPHEMFVINDSPSMPRGIYRIKPDPPALGDHIIFDGSKLIFPEIAINRRLLKKIAYCDGEAYCFTKLGLHIDGAFYPRIRDIGLEPGEGILRDGQCIILGEHPRSFDSRYFGPVPLSDCQKVVPLLVEKNKHEGN